MRYVSSIEVHLAEHGKSEEKFNSVLAMFLSAP